MPKVVSASPMNAEGETQHEQHHEEIVLPDHDASSPISLCHFGL